VPSDVSETSCHRPKALDVLVVGGGPAGLSAGRTLAEAGCRVVVAEEHAVVGEPVHCTGVLAREAFDELGLPSHVTLNELRTVRFHSPSGAVVDYETPTVEAVVIDRRALDANLADRARAAGVELRTGCRVTQVLPHRRGVTVECADGSAFEARAVVLASGANYTLARRLGLGLPSVFLQSAQRELPAARGGDVEVFFGNTVAPKGFAWIVPVARPDGPHVRVGVMAEQDAEQCFMALLAQRAASWGVAADAEAPRRKVLPLGSLARTYSDRVLVVGDAAGLVKPTTGGGIYYSVVTGRIAAEVLLRGLETDRLGAGDLAQYERQWRRRFRTEFGAQMALRMLSHRMTDADIDGLFELALTDGVMPIVRRSARFNQHRRLIVELFKHPPARQVLFRRLAGSVLRA
jgi:digeranylgeranylglycerophospholipid reductase